MTTLILDNQKTSATPVAPTSTAAPALARLTSMDAYRGLVMFLMMAEVLRLSRVASALPDSGFWQFLGHHQSHVPWVGGSLHDLNLNKNSNAAWAFDTWFLNLFPREKPFVCNGGGYSTLSFFPTLGTMILGLLAGGVVRSQRAPWAKVKWLAVAGVVGVVAGAALGWLGICPVVKRIWTPSWVLFSGGWCFLLLAACYAVIDIWGVRRWAFPLVVIGMNSIAAYCIAHLFDAFISSSLNIHLGTPVFKTFGQAYEPLIHGSAVLFVMWLILFWMYRRRLLLRI